MNVEARVRWEAARLARPWHACWDDLCQEGRLAAWLWGPHAVRWRMVDWLRAWSGQQGSKGHTPRETPASLDVPAGDDVEDTIGEGLADDGLDPADVVAARDMLARLSARERQVAVMCGAGWEGREVGDWWGVSRSRACQVRREMRDALEAA